MSSPSYPASCLLALLVGGALAPAAAAQSGGAPAAQPATRTAAPATARDEDIVVTGRAVPGAVIGDIPAENRLSPADIAGYGVGTVTELLDQISGQTQSDQGRDSSSGPVVLVNGKRISGVNEIGDLPTEAILRVDILPEEVALKYGYDAQQKVVNLILRRRIRTTVANIGGGGSLAGQGEKARADVTYTRIHDNDRVNVAARVESTASLRESERGLISATGAIDPTGRIADDTAYRTLVPATRTWSLNGAVAHQVSDAVTASLNAGASYATSAALQGLATATLDVTADNPFAISMSDTTINRYLDTQALRQDTATASGHLGATLNADVSTRWKLSVIANYDHGDTRTVTDRGYDTAALQQAIAANAIAVDPYGPLSAALLGPLQRERAVARSDAGSASAVLMGRLFAMPAGDVRVSLRLGGDVSALRSSTAYAGVTRTSAATRTTGRGQISLDVPLTSRRSGFLSGLGNLTANLNAGATRVADYGTLATFGYGLNWTPRTGISVIASVNEDRVAPTLQQLNAPVVVTQARVYDAVTGATVTVLQSTGGNAALAADDRHVVKLGVALKPFPRRNLSLSANYINSRPRNPIGTLSGATAATEAAFAERFTRDDTGMLTAVDSRAVNFAREDREEIRWGVNLTGILRAPRRPHTVVGRRPRRRAVALVPSPAFDDDILPGRGLAGRGIAGGRGIARPGRGRP
ncbi:hypothetical protein, partial [Sphingomonas sp. RIT328]|uniref:hypothetical protein n=1 Tax=Sphingomonas sp. RIT328 TaxID=1470591 RepID=UPI00069018B5